jgi:hypothetical protein
MSQPVPSERQREADQRKADDARSARLIEKIRKVQGTEQQIFENATTIGVSMESAIKAAQSILRATGKLFQAVSNLFPGAARQVSLKDIEEKRGRDVISPRPGPGPDQPAP